MSDEKVEKESKIFGLSIKEWVFVLSIFGVGGGGTYVGNIIGHKDVDNKVDESALLIELDSLKAQMNRAFSEKAAKAAVSLELGQMRGLEGDEAIEYVNGLMDFADEKQIDDSIWQTYYRPKLDGIINRMEGACGFVVPGESITEMFFVDCFGQPKRIHYDKVNGSTNSLYYYRGDDDRVIVIRYLNSTLQFDQ